MWTRFCALTSDKQRLFYLGPIIIALAGLGVMGAGRAKTAPSRNVILFVADGLRHGMVTPQNTPTLYALSRQGVLFDNSHSLFPTLTMANSSAIGTGHALADTGIFSNVIYTGFSVISAASSPMPFLESDNVVRELDSHFDNDLLDGDTLLSAAHNAGFSTAALGKLGPALLQALPGTRAPQSDVIVVDDLTGSPQGVALPADVAAAATASGVPLVAPPRGANGVGGDFKTAGTVVPNLVQQSYFANFATQVVLPKFKQDAKPFFMVYWSRDPDGTQHNQGDSLNRLVPGINGPTTIAALRNMDNNLKQILDTLKKLGLDGNTDIFITSDHGFSTQSKQSTTSWAAQQNYSDTVPGYLPEGFLSVDLAHSLGMKLYDPDTFYLPGSMRTPLVAGEHPANGLIGPDDNHFQIAVAANGGSDLIYLLGSNNRPARAQSIVHALLAEDYVSGIFAADDLGPIPGTLPMSDVGLSGDPRTPSPALSVSFRSFDTGCGDPTVCGVIVSDSFLQQGQGNHGSFGRQDTFNFQAALGPDFKQQFVDAAPSSNADVAITLSSLLGFNVPHAGPLHGRVLSEVLEGPAGMPLPNFSHGTVASLPGDGGLATVLNYQEVAGERYYDQAGFAGRTVGLVVK